MSKRVEIDINKIYITRAFRRTTPRASKFNECREYYRQNGKIDKDIIINRYGFLVDGYIRYLILLENGIQSAEVLMLGVNEDETTQFEDGDSGKFYAFGRHDTSPKEFCWVVNNATGHLEHMKIGNKMMVRTKNGIQKAMVTNIIRSETPPLEGMKIRSVAKFLDE